MNPGRMDTRCAFQSLTEVSDGGGGTTTTWTTQFSRWGAFAVPNLRASMENIAGGAVQSAVPAVLIVRNDSGTATITAQWRAVAKGKTWNIRGVQPGADGFIKMAVESGVAT